MAAWSSPEESEDMAIKTVAELRDAVGTEIALSDWIPVTQDRIDQFAEATGDRQWIHVDVERAAAGPFGTTIAHGYLTLSLLPLFAEELVQLEGIKMAANYGLNKVRFPAPVPSGSRVRGRTELLEVSDVPGGLQMVTKVTVELEGVDKPACVAESVARLYF
jgi:acyl dehydratase